MAAAEPVPPTSSVVRFCKYSTLAPNGAPDVGSFARRASEDGLSVNELSGEGEVRDQVAAAKVLMAPWLMIGPNGRFAVLPVASILAFETDPALTVHRTPSIDPEGIRPPNPHHCEIFNVPTEEDIRAGRTSILLSLVQMVTHAWRAGDV